MPQYPDKGKDDKRSVECQILTASGRGFVQSRTLPETAPALECDLTTSCCLKRHRLYAQLNGLANRSGSMSYSSKGLKKRDSEW